MKKYFSFIFIFFCVTTPSLKAQVLQENLFKNIVLKLDTLEFSLQSNSILSGNEKKIYFEYNTADEVCEVSLFPSVNLTPGMISLLPSGDFDIIDSVAPIDSQQLRFKVRFKDLTKSEFLKFRLAIHEKPDSTIIHEINLFPYTKTSVYFFPAGDELFIGEEKIFELTADNLGNIKPINDWQNCDDINYRVYLPQGYAKLKNLPVIYVTDGHEYLDDQKGSMVIVLDNLIAKNKIKPVIAVFIDPRDPDTLSYNKRESQFLINEKYLNFVSKELVKRIDSVYKTNKNPDDRAILGTSYGGVCATYFGLMRSNVFHLAAIQSPAYWGAPKLQEIYKNLPKLPLKIFMSTGTVNDGEMLTRMVKDMFEKNGYEIMYKEVSEGHSWGNWRALIDDMLIYFWSK